MGRTLDQAFAAHATDAMLSAARGQGNISEAVALTALADGAIWCGVDLPDGNGLRRMAQKVDGSLDREELIFLESRLPAGERGVLELLGGRRG
ncbi:MAG: hypothetical protein H0V29_07460, partial [Thermoleophilaceae bacterium]|nr:hypothetical protein [Thermoleophilaceae bacterium]